MGNLDDLYKLNVFPESEQDILIPTENVADKPESRRLLLKLCS